VFCLHLSLMHAELMMQCWRLLLLLLLLLLLQCQQVLSTQAISACN
jgi:hypothetical protein